MPQLIWLRNDLRSRDNTALMAAMAAGPTIALYLISPEQWRRHDEAPAKIDFWLRNLNELQHNLARLNVPLLVELCDAWDQAPAVISRLVHQHSICAVHVNAQYAVNERRRDQQVAERLLTEHVAWHEYHDAALLAPGTVVTGSGGYFKVYSAFRKRCLSLLMDQPPAPGTLPPAQAPLPLTSTVITEQIAGLNADFTAFRNLWPAGEQVALERLERFCRTQVEDYTQARDIPALAATSELSPYLAAGVVSVRQCLQRAIASNQGQIDGGSGGAQIWINQLIWRDFYLHVLVGYPRVSRHRPFRLETHYLPWRSSPDEFSAWQQGRTGIPIVDAGMRQLLACGWMHNRLRMICAMFLSKNLLIDWRLGEQHFMRHLIDGDLANNNGGWQWSASTGTDAAPYFRIFNPLSQGQRFDPDGTYIRQWVPELASASARDLHRFGALAGVNGYPAPLVELHSSRLRALQAFKQLPSLPNQ